MRSTLLPSILDNAAYNINRGEKNLKLFESARTYHKTGDGIREVPSICAVVTGNEKDEHWAVKNEQVSFYHIKGVISQLCELLGIDAEQCPVNKTYLINGSGLSYKQNDIELAYFGKLRPDMAERFSIDTLTMKQDLWILEFKMNDLIEVSRNRAFAYSDLPRYPSVTRDLSFLLPLEHSYADLSKETIACDPELIEELSIFDEYRSKQIPAGYRSVSIHLFLRDKQKTLTEERIEQVVESVVKKLQEKLQIIMR
jgi:phenylalanyl-tRNA synthetase beta chain